MDFEGYLQQVTNQLDDIKTNQISHIWQINSNFR